MQEYITGHADTSPCQTCQKCHQSPQGLCHKGRAEQTSCAHSESEPVFQVIRAPAHIHDLRCRYCVYIFLKTLPVSICSHFALARKLTFDLLTFVPSSLTVSDSQSRRTSATCAVQEIKWQCAHRVAKPHGPKCLTSAISSAFTSPGGVLIGRPRVLHIRLNDIIKAMETKPCRTGRIQHSCWLL